MEKYHQHFFVLSVMVPCVFSPIGEVFRARLRQFPALVNCCTIDWFSEWPSDALQSVAMRFLVDIPDLDASDEVMDGLVSPAQYTLELDYKETCMEQSLLGEAIVVTC